MPIREPPTELAILRQVFAAWWIAIPPTFEETFIAEDSYWHAWDEHRSVSLTSYLLHDKRGRPVRKGQVLRRMPAGPGERVEPPPGIDGWAVIIDVEPPSRASRAVTGPIATDGRVLLATVTADDLDWATRTWRSIVHDPTAEPPVRTPRQPGGAGLAGRRHD